MAAPSSLQTNASGTVMSTARAQPSIACGPWSADMRAGIVMNGPMPIMLVMFNAVAWSRPKRRSRCGSEFPSMGWPFMDSLIALAIFHIESKLIDSRGCRHQKRSANMAKQNKISAGLLMYRLRDGHLEVFLAHPGGPLFKNKDEGHWSIPKGEIKSDEELLAAAIREFEEETGLEPRGDFIELGAIQQKGGKIVHAWAFPGDWDETRPLESN